MGAYSAPQSLTVYFLAYFQWKGEG